MMKTSIIIPTYNEEIDIKEAIVSLQKQSVKDIEMIIVDDGSTDNTVKIVKEHAKKDKRIKLILGQHKGPGYSRNLGARNAKGQILVFVDSDMTFEKDYLKKLIKPILASKKVIGTTHELELVENTSNIWSKCWGRVRVSKEEAKDVKIFRAIRKKNFLALGGFDPKYGYADDQTFFFKYKIKPTLAKNTVCYHKNPEKLKAVYKQSRWIGASIDKKIFTIPVIKYILPLILYILFPIVVPVMAVRKCYKNKSFSIFPEMLIFMFVRYFGSIEGIIRNVYFKKNFR